MPESAIARQLAYWTRSAAGTCPISSICRPTGRGRRWRAIAATACRSTLAAELHRGLLALARDSEASLFMVLQAGLAALLTRLGAGTDIPIGSPIAGRTDSALDDLVGLLRQHAGAAHRHVGQSELPRAAWRGCGRSNLAAYGHQDLPFERLVEVLNPARSLSRHPLFQVMLALQNNAPASFELPGLSVSARAGRHRQRQVRPVAEPGGAARRGRHAGGDRRGDRIRDRPVRSRERGGAGGAAGSAAGGGGGGAGSRDRPARHSRAGRAPHHPAGVERHRACDAVRHPAGAVRGPGCARRPDAVAVVFEDEQPQLWRARCARQPAGASSARARRRPRDGGGAVRRALARDGGRAARHPQGGRRLSAARPRLSAGAPGLHAGGCRGARCWSRRRRCAIGLPRMAPASCGSMPTGRPSRGSPRPRRPSRSTRTTPPTSSTPRAPPERRRASRHPCAASPVSRLRRSTASALRSEAPRPAVRIAELRCLDLGDLRTVLTSGATLVLPRAERSGEALAAADCASSEVTHATLAASGAGGVCPEDLPLQTLMVAGEACPADVGRRAGRQGRRTDQRLWPDRDDGLRHA